MFGRNKTGENVIPERDVLRLDADNRQNEPSNAQIPSRNKFFTKRRVFIGTVVLSGSLAMAHEAGALDSPNPVVSTVDEAGAFSSAVYGGFANLGRAGWEVATAGSSQEAGDNSSLIDLDIEEETSPDTDVSPEITIESNPIPSIIGAGSPDMPCDSGEIIKQVNTSTKEIALTIDDGPSEATTRDILRQFEETGTVGTFFFIANRMETEQGKQLALEVLEAGHEIAAHSYSHNMQDPDVNAAEHQKANQIFEDVFGTIPYAYRAPGFGMSPTLESTVTESGQCFIDRSRYGDSKDWKSDFLPPEEALEQLKAYDDIVIENLTPGAIIYAHDQVKDSPADGGRDRTRAMAAQHIRYLIDGIQAEGYSLVTVSDLLTE